MNAKIRDQRFQSIVRNTWVPRCVALRTEAYDKFDRLVTAQLAILEARRTQPRKAASLQWRGALL